MGPWDRAHPRWRRRPGLGARPSRGGGRPGRRPQTQVRLRSDRRSATTTTSQKPEGQAALTAAFAKLGPDAQASLARASGKPAILHCIVDPEAITPSATLTGMREAAQKR